MPEFQHPPIDLTLEPCVTEERLFAESAFQLLGDMGGPASTVIDNVVYRTQMTQRVDFLANNGTQIGLRLRGMPVLGMDKDAKKLAATADYFVIEIQQACTEEPEEFATDDEFTWLSYMSIIMDTHDIDNVDVVDSNTGKSLADEDLVYAKFILGKMRQEYDNQYYAEAVSDAARDVQSNTAILQRGYAPFKSSDFFELCSCEHCGTQNVPCEHNPEMLN